MKRQTEGDDVLIEDRIERETLINAPIERVWALVAEPGWWAVPDPVAVAGTVAREGETMISRNETYGDFPVRVERVEPPTYVSYRWASAFPGQELRGENSTLIEFALSDEDGKTRLRVVESGFGGLDGGDELRRKALEDNTGGWAEEIANLKARAEQSLA